MTGPRTTGPRGFDPDELGTNDPADLADALESARWLVASIEDVPASPGPRFTGRVMAALADEPTPAAVGFLAPIRRLGLIAGFGASVRQAWASIGAPGRPAFARATALAYILIIAIAGTSLAGAATIGFAGALGLINPPTIQASPSTMPFQSTQPGKSEQPSAQSEPPGSDASEEPGGSPDASDDHGGSGGPEPSDDHGDTSGLGSSGSDGGDGSDDRSVSGDHIASPTSTSSSGSDDGGASPTGTPKPSQTSGSGGGSSSSD